MSKRSSVSIIIVFLIFLASTTVLAKPILAEIDDNTIYLPIVLKNVYGENIFENMVTIPAGEFQMGCDPDHNDGIDCNISELPIHSVYLDAYLIDKYEVTNEQYAVFLNNRDSNDCNGTECLDLDGHDVRISLDGSEYVVESGYEDHPVIDITWYGADSYCTENGYRLPTEAEWEKAARGTTVQTFPWGDQSPDCTYANFYYDGDYCVGDTTAVGNYSVGASPYELLDMSGNVEDWVNDWYEYDYYSSSPYSNPTGPTSGNNKALRGGSWYHGVYFLRTSSRIGIDPSVGFRFIGFRCAVSTPVD